MLLAEQRPLLREARLPVVARAHAQRADRLHDPRLLIERFLDEKRVVDDLERPRALRMRRGCHRRDEDEHARDLHQELRGRACADGDAAIVLAAQPHAVGRLVALLDLHRLAGLQVVALHEAEELLVLIDDARDGHARAHRARQERLRLLLLDHPFGVRNGIPMRIDLGTSEHLVHAIDEAVGDDMLEQFRFVVHFVPAEAHYLHEKQLHETMPPQDAGGEPPPRARQRHAGIRLVIHQPGFRQRLDHRRRGPRGDGERGGELSHRQQARLPAGVAARAEVDGLQVVLDGARRQHVEKS